MPMRWSTDDVPPAQRFAYWREALCASIGAVTPARPADTARFEGRIAATLAGPVALIRVETTGPAVTRTRRDVARIASDHYWLYRHRRDPARFRLDSGEEAVLRPGDLVLGASDATFAVAGDGPMASAVAYLPRHLVAPHLAAPQAVMRGRVLRGDAGAGALLAGFADGLHREAEGIDPLDAQEAAAILGRLFALAAGERGAEDRQAVQAARLATARRIVAARFADPTLTPETLSQAMGLSPRSLHLLFEGSGETAAACILRHRLEAARAILADPRQAARSIADIAFACGFNALATFYRAFRNRYGMAPAECRPGG